MALDSLWASSAGRVPAPCVASKIAKVLDTFSRHRSELAVRVSIKGSLSWSFVPSSSEVSLGGLSGSEIMVRRCVSELRLTFLLSWSSKRRGC